MAAQKRAEPAGNHSIPSGRNIDKQTNPGPWPGPKETEMKTHKIGAVLLAAAAGGTVLLSATAAGAAVAPRHGHASGGATKSTRLPSVAPRYLSTLPKGYTVVTTDFTAYPNTQVAGAASCPGTEQPVGGGAVASSSDLQVNVNSSYPAGASWVADVSDASASSTGFTVYAICMAHSPYYKVVKSPLTWVNSETVNSQAVACPANTSVTGGGAQLWANITDVNINSTVPAKFASGRTGWGVAMANSDPYSNSYYVYAVCRPKPLGYSIQWGATQQLGPWSEGEASVTCPGASVPIGGGGFTDYNTNDAWLTMNSSAPAANSWAVFENNYSVNVKGVEAAAVCAGT
jgi:hypothetical protein